MWGTVIFTVDWTSGEVIHWSRADTPNCFNDMVDLLSVDGGFEIHRWKDKTNSQTWLAYIDTVNGYTLEDQHGT